MHGAINFTKALHIKYRVLDGSKIKFVMYMYTYISNKYILQLHHTCGIWQTRSSRNFEVSLPRVWLIYIYDLLSPTAGLFFVWQTKLTGPQHSKIYRQISQKSSNIFWDFGDFKLAALASCLVTTTFPGKKVHELLLKLMLILSNFRLLFILTGLHFGTRRQWAKGILETTTIHTFRLEIFGSGE